MADPNNKLPDRGPAQPKGPGNFAFIFFIIASVIFIAFFYRGDKAPVMSVSYSDFLRLVEENKVESVTVYDDKILDIYLKGSPTGGSPQLKTRAPILSDATFILQNNGVNITSSPAKVTFMRIIIDILPWVIGFTIIMIIFRNIQGAGMKNFHLERAKPSVTMMKGKK